LSGAFIRLIPQINPKCAWSVHHVFSTSQSGKPFSPHMTLGEGIDCQSGEVFYNLDAGFAGYLIEVGCSLVRKLDCKGMHSRPRVGPIML